MIRTSLAADFHLGNKENSPERYSALENVISQIESDGINTLIIAGDLFDESLQNYSEFEAVCKAHLDVHFLIVPGNHDPLLSSSQIVAPNVVVFNKPIVRRLDENGPAFFFLPFERNRTMGERIADFASQLPPNEWVLIAHGDWLDGLSEVNLYESGFYMPLTRKDIETFKPKKVFLGHIHAPMDRQLIHYTGSPCGLDINETGPRRFLVYNTHSDTVESRQIKTEIIYYNETMTVLPLENEENYLRDIANELIRKWHLDPEDTGKVRLRLKVRGFSTDREALLRVLKECFKDYIFYKNEDPDIAEVSVSTDPDRSQLAEIVRERILARALPTGGDEPAADEVLLAALAIIYRGK